MEILHKLKPLLALKIPWFVRNVNISRQYEILVFCDASMKAYATAVYLCIEKQNTFFVILVFSKMWLASKGTSKKRLRKDITLPRLKLLAVTIGVRAANFVASEMKIASLKRILTQHVCYNGWKLINHCQYLLIIELKKYWKQLISVFVMFHQMRTQ